MEGRARFGHVVVEIWSDVLCPWCYIGKRRFEKALAQFEHANELTVLYRSFELNPKAPREETHTLTRMLAEKYHISEADASAMNARVTTMAKAEGLDYRLDQARPSNSFDAHRIIHLALEIGLQAEMVERLYAAYFSEGQSVSERTSLLAMASEVGVRQEAAAEVLDSDRFSAQVREDEALAASLGIASVPFFVVDRSLGLAGAHEPDTLLQVLRQGWEQRAGAEASKR